MTITERESDAIESHQTFIPPLEGNKTLPLHKKLPPPLRED